MDRFNAPSYYSSLLLESPAVRDSRSRHANRFIKSSEFAEQSSMNLLSSTLINQSTFLSANESFNETDTRFKTAFEDIEEETSIEPCLTLYQQFFDNHRKYSSNDDNVLDLLNEYELLCCDHLSVTTSLIKSKVRQLSESVSMNKLENVLRLERNSWRLAKIMFEDRLKESILSDSELMAVDDLITKMSDKMLIDRCFERDSNLRRMQLVIDWLESNQVDDYEYLNNDKVEFYSEGPYAWENTLHSLKTKSGLNYGKEREMCVAMDADASIRTKRALHDLDKEDETRLFRHIFHLLRGGQLHEGKDVAQKMGYFWLAAALEGWLLHHDPNYLNDYTVNRHVEPIEGNDMRDLWKSVCWRSAKMEGITIYERALFGVLSGNIAVVLPLCTRWSDKLWAFYKCSLDVHIESILRETIVVKPEAKPRYLVDLPDAYWDCKLNDKEIFREIESQGSVSSIAEDTYHQTVQKFIILGDMGALIDHMYEWSKVINDLREPKKEQSSKQQIKGAQEVYNECQWQVVGPQILRFFAHLVLSLRQLKISTTRDELCVAVLERYIRYLIDTKQIELVAYYTAHLPKRNQIITFANLLEGIEDVNDRQMCIVLAQNANLDVSAITAAVVELVRTRPDELAIKASEDLANFATADDQKKINSLDWLLFDEVQQFGEALRQANSLMRHFLLTRKVEAAKQTFLKLPADIIDCIFKQWRRKTGKSELIADDDNAVREYLCHKAYFQANDAFSDWIYCYNNTKPKEPPKPVSNRFTDKVAYEHCLKQYEVDLEEWKLMLKQQGKLAADKIENVLLFPDGGWMCDQLEAEEREDTRAHQMKQLQRLYIPHLVFILHSIHHASNNLVECLRIADIVADESKTIYKTFTSEQLNDLLKKFRETSIVILNESQDPLGYDIVKQ